MAALFGKKEERSPPVDRVKSMMAAGLSEREIIRQLKAEGYGFGQIEKAMMTALKEGVAAPPIPGAAPPAAPPAMPPGAPAAPAPYPPPEWPAPAYPPPAALPEALPLEEEAAPIPLELPPLEAPPAEEMPEDVLEDILEGIAEEKFEKFSSEIKKVSEELEKARAEIRAVREKPAAEVAVPKELADKIDDLEARIGGLEKAFRQFLPSLTENIEALAKIIHEMRGVKKETAESSGEKAGGPESPAA